MSWLNDLYQTYEACKDEVGIIQGERPTLLPIAHSTQNAQIEITLDGEGNFLRARRLEKEEAVTIIPVTEDSASRSSGVAPHPLADKLEYIAGDYGKFVGKYNKEKHHQYIEILRGWAQSEYATVEIKSVYMFISKQSVIENLRSTGVLEVENGKLTKSKIDLTEQKDFLVRFCVEIPGEIESRLFCNQKIFDSYVKYYLSKQDEKRLCYVSGKIVPCSDKHPSKIRHAGDKSKLISSNDASGVFTYKGRFYRGSDVASIGYEYSQKAHNALRWLIAKQACLRAGEQVIVVWSAENRELPDPFAELWGEERESSFTDEDYAKSIRRAIWGNSNIPIDSSNVIVMGVEAATTGRLSITYYQKCNAEEFINYILLWKQQVAWKKWNYKENDYKSWSPSLNEIVKQAVGDRNDKVIKATRERLVPCIVQGRKFPIDIVRLVVNQAYNPASFQETYEWWNCIQLACALIRKMQYDKKIIKEESEMSLDTNSRDRSYLFGRLLATAEVLEKRATGTSDGGSRNTAAEKYFQRFQRYPSQTWKTIRNALQPYIMKLNTSGNTYYIRVIDQVVDMFEADDFTKNESLGVAFLQGYSSQMMEYKNYNKKEDKEDKNNE